MGTSPEPAFGGYRLVEFALPAKNAVSVRSVVLVRCVVDFLLGGGRLLIGVRSLL